MEGTVKLTFTGSAPPQGSRLNLMVNAGNIACETQANAQLYFIHTDHLNTPRLITNTVGLPVWRWDNNDPYGNNAPNENPSGAGNFTCNLRLPGQYFDAELNTHYNYFRDYDPSTGRYVQSDPIGLFGGVNTYAYVGGNPLSHVDPQGLYWFQQPWQARDPLVGREGSVVPPGGRISNFIERYVPAGRTMAEIHDPLVDLLTRAGVPDLMVNVPTMSWAYRAALVLEILRSLGLVNQPKPPYMCAP